MMRSNGVTETCLRRAAACSLAVVVTISCAVNSKSVMQRKAQYFVSASSLCSEAQFLTALQKISPLMPGAVDKLGGEHCVYDYFVTTYGESQCRNSTNVEDGWPKAKRSLSLVAGMGTTGTRFLHCVFTKLGFRSAHQNIGMGYRFCHVTRNCTAYWDQHDVVEDSIVPGSLDAVIATHHGDLLTGALLPLRDPWEWQQSRISTHSGWADVSLWEAGNVCSVTDQFKHKVLLKDVHAPMAFVASNVFSACLLLNRGLDDFFAFNVFDQLPNNFPDVLASFLLRTSTHELDPHFVKHAMDVCH